PPPQPRRKGGPARPVLVDRAEPLLEERPVDRPCQLHQRVAHIDDRVQPRAQKIGLPAVASFLRSHRSPPMPPRKSRLAIRGKPKIKLQAFKASNRKSL